MTTIHDQDPYEEGVAARIGGHSETSNPYDPEAESSAHMHWNDGWASADDEDSVKSPQDLARDVHEAIKVVNAAIRAATLAKLTVRIEVAQYMVPGQGTEYSGLDATVMQELKGN